MDLFENVDRKCKKNYDCEEKRSKCSTEQTLLNNRKFVWSNKMIVQVKMEHEVWQPSFDQTL